MTSAWKELIRRCIRVRKKERIPFVTGIKFHSKKSSGLKVREHWIFLMRYLPEASSLARFTIVSIGFASLLWFMALIYV